MAACALIVLPLAVNAQKVDYTSPKTYVIGGVKVSGIKYLSEHGVKRVYWDANVNNNPSISLAIKNGFKYLEDGSNDPLWNVYVKDL